jgi:hypothetical protein
MLRPPRAAESKGQKMGGENEYFKLKMIFCAQEISIVESNNRKVNK